MFSYLIGSKARVCLSSFHMSRGEGDTPFLTVGLSNDRKWQLIMVASVNKQWGTVSLSMLFGKAGAGVDKDFECGIGNTHSSQEGNILVTSSAVWSSSRDLLSSSFHIWKDLKIGSSFVKDLFTMHLSRKILMSISPPLGMKITLIIYGMMLTCMPSLFFTLIYQLLRAEPNEC